MKLIEYQNAARKTDQFPKRAVGSADADRGDLVPLLGLTGEVGALLSEYKKLLRDGPVHARFNDRLEEELGDILWYVATVATRFRLSLEEIADKNLKKTQSRWLHSQARAPFDTLNKPTERLPESFSYEFGYALRKDGTPAASLRNEDGKRIGDLLTDNAHENDGYRFHDVMHFAFVSILGWSPVARKLLKRKRKSSRRTDEVEDGGRANVIDEAIVAMVFDYINHDLQGTRGIRRIDSETLRSIRALTRGFEVHARTEADWESAIIKGLEVWRQVEEHDGGFVIGDFHNKQFTFAPPTTKMTRRVARR